MHQNVSARWRHDRAVETHLHRGLEKALKVPSPDDRHFLKPPRIGVNKETRVRRSPKIMRWRHRARVERPKAFGLKYSSFRQRAAADFPPKAEFERSLFPRRKSFFWIYLHVLFMTWLLLPLACSPCHGLFTEPLVNPLAVNSGVPRLVSEQVHESIHHLSDYDNSSFNLVPANSGIIGNNRINNKSETNSINVR